MLLRGIGIIYCSLLSTALLAGEASQLKGCLQDAAALERASNYLAVLTALPTPPIVPVSGSATMHFATSSQLFSEILDVSPHAVILNEIEELRFISYTLARTSILLVLNSAEGFTAEKSRRVTAVAKMMGIKISLVWLENSNIPEALQSLMSSVRGQSWRLSDLTREVMDKTCDSVSP
ncbi:MAG: hypothetical protein NTX25_22620 [Proteobacteria bacterium]|nr:hypothetical protein [Pseudomonadota bacterium]